MATPAGPSQPNLSVPTPQAANEPQISRGSQGAETIATTHDDLGKLSKPGITGVFNPDASFQTKKYTEAAGAEATAGMANTEGFRPEKMEIDAELSESPEVVYLSLIHI